MPKPTAAANATAYPTGSHRRLLLAYADWLHLERRILCDELGVDERLVVRTPAREFHLGSELKRNEAPPPSVRAVRLMEAAGVDIRAIKAWAKKRPAYPAADVPPRPQLRQTLAVVHDGILLALDVLESPSPYAVEARDYLTDALAQVQGILELEGCP